MRLKNKIMLRFIVVIIVSILTLSGIFYVWALVDIEDSVHQAYEKNLYQLSDKLSYVFSDLKNTANAISSDIDFLQMVETIEQVDNNKKDEYKHTIKKILPHHAGNYIITYDSLFCTTAGDVILSGSQEFFYNYEAGLIMASPWFYERQGDARRVRFMDSETMFDKDMRDAGFYIVQSVNDFYDGKQLGTLRIGFSYKFLVHELRQVLSDNSQVYIVNDNGYIVCSSDESLIGTYGGPEKENKKTILEADIEGTPWKAVGVVEPPALESQKANILLIIILGSSVCLIFSLYFTQKISNQVSKPIEDLIETVRTIRRGQFMVTVPAINHDEISLLGLEIQNMADQLDHLIHENLEKEEKKCRAEMKFLSAQISPHFLNNTLKSIAALAQFNRNEEIEQMILALTKLLKTAMSNGQETILLKEELDILRSYLMIMEIRYNYGIDYSMEINPELENLHVPKLILQPLVENSIFHGMNEANSCQFSVHIYVDYLVEDHTKVSVKIIDNGIGMNQEKVEQLKKKVSMADGGYEENGWKQESIGIVNVIQRLKYYYPGVTIHFDSILNEGTTIEIILNIEELNENIISG